jgi:hypothetical protein
MEFHCNYNVAHPLGKGEVVSSILTGSTMRARFYEAFYALYPEASRSYARTDTEPRKSTGGKSVDSVHGRFA